MLLWRCPAVRDAAGALELRRNACSCRKRGLVGKLRGPGHHSGWCQPVRAEEKPAEATEEGAGRLENRKRRVSSRREEEPARDLREVGEPGEKPQWGGGSWGPRGLSLQELIRLEGKVQAQSSGGATGPLLLAVHVCPPDGSAEGKEGRVTVRLCLSLGPSCCSGVVWPWVTCSTFSALVSYLQNW